jgi:CYTH domain-containing protein
MLRDLCDKPLIEKTRYKTSYCGQTWEIDEFAGDNAGLVVAEVELTAEDQQIELPGWIGREVTADPRYYNASLYKNPFKNWPEQPSAKN